MSSTAPTATGPDSPPARWRPLALSLAWAAAVLVAYAGLFDALGNTFTIENTGEAMARADRGRALAALWVPLVVALAVVPLRRPLRAPRLAAGCVATPGVLSGLLAAVDQSGIVGLLLLVITSPVVLAGLVLGVLPARAKPPLGPERRPAVLIVIAGCALVALVLLVLSLTSVLVG